MFLILPQMCEGQDNSVCGSTMQMSNYKCQISRCFLTIYIHCAEWCSKYDRIENFILFSKTLKHKISELESIFDIILFAILIVWKYSPTLCFKDTLSVQTIPSQALLPAYSPRSGFLILEFLQGPHLWPLFSSYVIFFP